MAKTKEEKKIFALPSHKKRNDTLVAYTFLTPALILFIVFTVVPFIIYQL